MKKLIDLYLKISNKSYTTLSSSIAFFLIINGGSLIYLILVISNFLNLDIVNYLNYNNTYLTTKMIIDDLELDVISLNNYSWFLTITSIFSASTLFFHLIKVGEIIYQEQSERYTVKKRVFSVIITIIFIIVIITIILAVFIIDYLLKNINVNLLGTVLKTIIYISIPFVIALIINMLVTPNKAKIKEVIYGVVLTTFFWYIATFGFTIYLKIFLNFKIVYGALTFLVVFMVWIYLMSIGLIIGFIINHQIRLKKIILDKI